MRALMIEDFFMKAGELEQALQLIGVEDYKLAENRDDAIELLRKEKYDFILLDMFFPQERGGFEYPMCGLQILDWLDKNDRDEVVIVTSSVKCDMSDYERVIGQIHYGFDDVEFKLEELVVTCGLQ